MKKIFVVVGLFVTMIFTACGGGDNNFVNNSRNTNKIIIGIDDEFPPICFHNERNELVGFDIDLIKEATERMGVKTELRPIEWDKKREEILSGNVDMIWNGLDITQEREEYMIFTRPYMDDRQVVLVNKGNGANFFSEDDLEGKIVGVQAGSTSEDYINNDENLKNRLGGFKVYKKFNGVIEALRNEEIDALICDELIARYEIKKYPNQFELINVKIGNAAEMAIGFPKDKKELRDRVQKILDEMIKDGTAKKISEKWFKADLIKSM